MLPVKHIFQKFDADNHVLDVADDESHRIFIDRGGSVLFVAHLDTVRKPRLRKSDRRYIHGQGFDDRLGCMLAYNLSKELGADLLLTDHEEGGGTTARYHKTKDYNWIVEFDREGIDVVTYGLDGYDFRQILENYWNIGFGSYSDICDIKTDACCFNLGLGHRNSHSKNSFIKIKELESQIDKFKEFYAVHKDTKYVRTKQTRNFTDDRHYLTEKDRSYFVGDVICEFCGADHGTKIYGYIVCSACFENMAMDFEHSYNRFSSSDSIY